MRKLMGLWRIVLAVLVLACVGHSAQASETVVYYHTDALHSVSVVTNAQGQVIERTYYAPYGAVLNRPLRDGPGYTGHQEDAEIGLVYMQQRYYDPETGRFLSPDPVQADASGANFNRCWYANDNPYRYTDPDGRAPDTDFGLGRMAQSFGGSPEATNKMAPFTLTGVGAMLAATGAPEAGIFAAAGKYLAGRVAGETTRQAAGKVEDISGKRPFTGEPGSTVRGRDGNRTYAKDGYPQTDRDRPHPAETGKQGAEDHSHD